MEYRPDFWTRYVNGSFTSGEYIQELLKLYFDDLKDYLLGGVSDILPMALTVAGAILVVNLGWRLFRNFTHG